MSTEFRLLLSLKVYMKRLLLPLIMCVVLVLFLVNSISLLLQDLAWKDRSNRHCSLTGKLHRPTINLQ